MNDELSQDTSSPSVGELLKEARKAQEISLEVVAQNLCINKRLLKDLESNHESLTTDVYTLGFLRSYAHSLNLDSDLLVQKFKSQISQAHSPKLTFPTPLPERGRPSLLMICLSLLILGALIIGYEWMKPRPAAPMPQEKPASLPQDNGKTDKPAFPQKLNQPLSQEDVFPQTSPSEQAIESSADLVSPQTLTPPPVPLLPLSNSPPAPVPSSQAAPLQLIKKSDFTLSSPLPSQAVLLTVDEDAWVEVKDGHGNIVLRDTCIPGKTYKFNNPKDLVLKTGNAGAIHLNSEGKTLFFQGRGRVRSGIHLDPLQWPK